jgi:DNA-binding GntR family transcriptional regulator
VFDRHRSTLIEHANIIQALKSKNSDETRAAVYTHIDG